MFMSPSQIPARAMARVTRMPARGSLFGPLPLASTRGTTPSRARACNVRGAPRIEPMALDRVARHKPSALVIVVLRPIRNSPMGHVDPPDPEMVARFMALARFKMPDVPQALSCARPPGKYRKRLDSLAVEAGVNRIAMPAEEALERARELGMGIEFHHTCCSKSF